MRDGIGVQLLIAIVLFSSVVTLILSAIDLYVAYRVAIATLDHRLDEIEGRSIGSLGAALWDMDRQRLQLLAQGIAKLPDIGEVQIRETGSTSRAPMVVTIGEHQTDRAISRDIPISYAGDGNARTIGMLHIEATLTGIYRSLGVRARSILADEAVKTLLVASFILTITRRLVTRHILDLASKVADIKPGGRLPVLRLNRPLKYRDEFDQVVNALNTLGASLASQEADLKCAIARMAAILDNIPDLAWVKDLEGKFIAANQMLARTLGFSDACEIIGKTDFDVSPKEIAERHRTADQEVIATGESKRVEELQWRAGDQSTFWIETIKTPLKDPAGRIVGTVGLARDLTERKAMDDALQASEREWREVFEHNPVMYFMLDSAGTVLSVNAFGAAQLGYTVGELVGQSVLNVFLEEDREFIRGKLDICLEKLGQSSSWETRKVGHDGTVLWVRENAKAVRRAGNQVIILIACEDITERKRTEDALRQSEMYLAEAQAISGTGSFGWRVSTGEIVWSVESFRIFQYERTVKPTVDLVLQRIHPENTALAKQAIERASQEGKDLDFEQRLLMPDGSVKHIHVVAHTARDESGALEFVGAVMDVTAAKEAEARTRLIIDTVPALLWTAGSDGIVNFVNRRWSDYTGLTPEQAVRSGWIQVVHPDDLEATMTKTQAMMTEGKPFEYEVRIKRSDGEYRWFLTRAFPLTDRSGRVLGWYGNEINIHDRKQAEEKLRQSEKRFRAMVEKSAEGIALGTPESGVIYASPSVERVLGYTPEEFAGRTLYDRVHPDHSRHITDAVAVLLQEPSKVVTDEVMLRHKDGSWRWVETTMRNLLAEPSVRALVVNFRDLTERKHAQAERERLELRLRQAEKMEAIGRLASGIAHDFNNVLAGIFAYGEMLFEETSGDSPLKRYAKNVLTAATRGRALVEQILAYSRSQRGKRAPVDVAQVVAETLELLRGSLPAEICLEAGAPELPLIVVGDATQLHQVVMNLCSNAIQAMNGAGTLRVALEAVDFPAERALSHGALKAGRYARLTVEDSGSGMDETTLSRIFEPFFTTKEIGRGTGLGLSLVYAIVTDAGGAIDVQSALEQGSIFTIYVTRAAVALVTAGEAAAPLPRGNGRRTPP